MKVSKKDKEILKDIYDKNILELSERFSEVTDEYDGNLAVLKKDVEALKSVVEASRARTFSFFYDRTKMLADHLGLQFGYEPARPATESKEMLEPNPWITIESGNKEKPHTFFWMAFIAVVSFILGISVTLMFK